MEFPIVSVIVPIYEVEKYLQRCIDSIRNQTYEQLEIILVDDGSPDGCGAICDEYSKSDSRIVVIHKENGGLSSARNVGLDVATGKYVAFIDADDTVHAKFIETLLGLCEKYECDIAQCDFLTVSEESLNLPLNLQEPLAFYTGKQALSKLCVEKNDVPFVIAWNKIYKRELFCEIRYPIGRIHEDEFTTYQILWKARKIVVTNQYLYYYLQRPDSIVRRKYSVKRLDALDAFKERMDFLKKNKLETEFLVTMQKYIGLIEKNCKALKENVEGYEDTYDTLLREKYRLEEQFPQLLISKEQLFQVKWTTDTCPYPKDSKLVLYGAGRWGCVYYQWIQENQWGVVVGWIDNSWSGIKDTGYPVTPLDSLLSMTYDYILLTIQSKAIQEKIVHNLRCWGISEENILTI